MIKHLNKCEVSLNVTNEDFIIAYKFLDKAIEYRVIDALGLKSVAVRSYLTAKDMGSIDNDTITTLYETFCTDNEDECSTSKIGYNILGTYRNNFDYNRLISFIFGKYYDELNITFISMENMPEFELNIELRELGKALNIFIDNLDSDMIFSFTDDANTYKIPKEAKEVLERCSIKQSLIGVDANHIYIDGFYSIGAYQKQLKSKVIGYCKIHKNITDKNIRAISDTIIHGDSLNDPLKVELDRLNFTSLLNIEHVCMQLRWAIGLNILGTNNVIKVNTVGCLVLERCNNCVVIIEDSILHGIKIRDCKNIVIIFKKSLSNASARVLLSKENFIRSYHISIIADFYNRSTFDVIESSEVTKLLDCCSAYTTKSGDIPLGYGGYIRIKPIEEFYKKYGSNSWLNDNVRKALWRKPI